MSNVIEILKKASDCYYNTQNYYEMTEEEMDEIIYDLEIPVQALMTDAMYDEIYTRAKKKYPNDLFFTQVGAEVRGDKVKLPMPLGSMVECKEGELIPWLNKNTDYVISEKLDGNSALLVYVNGKLKVAYTRGDGIEGQDITRHIKRFQKAVPDNVSVDGKLFTGMVRGEIIVSKRNIPLMLAELKEETHKDYKNGRNTVAGQLNSKVCAESFTKYAEFLAYHISGFDGLSEYKKFVLIGNMGFRTPKYWIINPNTEQCDEDTFTELVHRTKVHGEFECDGIIVTQNVVQPGYEGFETSSLNPKCSRKYKVGAIDNTDITEVEYIEWNVSKDGYFKPRVKVKPVKIQGVTIEFATGHNYGNIISQKICVGAKIQLKRSGDVIPYIEKVLSYPEVQNYTLPEEIMYDEVLTEDYKPVDIELVDGVDFGPNNSYMDEYKTYYSEMMLQKLIYFCQKMNVEFSGEGNIKRLMEITANPNMDVHNLLVLPKNVFEEAIGVNGLKFYDSLHNAMKKTNQCQFFDATGTFGRGIGELKLQKVYDKYNELPFDKGKILATDGWADKMADQYMSKFVHAVNWVDWLYKNYNSFVFPVIKKEVFSQKYLDTKVVFTGVRDKALEEIITSNGGKVLSSITKECNLVVAKDPSGSSSKLQKARDLGIEIVSLQQAKEKFV